MNPLLASKILQIMSVILLVIACISILATILFAIIGDGLGGSENIIMCMSSLGCAITSFVSSAICAALSFLTKKALE
ncbi:MAG: hypothetical protein RR137_10940 [Odoribacter sp.]